MKRKMILEPVKRTDFPQIPPVDLLVTLSLSCSYENVDHRTGEFPRVYTGSNQAIACNNARYGGWYFDLKKKEAACPRCARSLKIGPFRSLQRPQSG